MTWFFLFLLTGAALAPVARRKIITPGAMLALGMAVFVLWRFFSLWLFSGRGTALFALVMAAVLVTRALRWRGSRPRFSKVTLPANRPRRLVVLALLLVNVLGLFTLFRLAGTPVLNYDVLSYHVPLAWDVWAGGAKSFFAPEIFYARMPLGAPILEAPFVAPERGGAAGTALHFFLMAAMLAGANSAARCAAWLGARRAGRLLAAGLFLFHPLLTNAFMNALVEPLLGLLSIAALEMLLMGFARRGNAAALVAAGLCAASAMSVKFSAAGTAVLPIAGLAFIFGLAQVRTARLRAVVLPGCVAAGMLLAMGPWTARAMALGGHPLYPFQGESTLWSHEQAQFVVNVHNPQPVLSASYLGDLVMKNSVLGYAPLGLPLSVLLLAAALGLTLPRARKTSAALLAMAFLGYLFFLTVRGNPARFVVPSAILLVPLAARAVAADFALKPFRAAILGGFALLVLPTMGAALRDALRFAPVYRIEERRLYQEPDLARGSVIDAAREHALSGGRLLLLFEARPALFAPGTIYNTVWDRPLWAEDLRAAKDEEDFRRRLRQSGITAVFVNEAEWGRLLDFYAQEAIGTNPRLFMNIGIRGTAREDLMRYLAAFPPFRFAGFTERDLTILADFLLTQRRRADAAAPAGPVSEYWFTVFDAVPEGE